MLGKKKRFVGQKVFFPYCVRLLPKGDPRCSRFSLGGVKAGRLEKAGRKSCRWGTNVLNIHPVYTEDTVWAREVCEHEDVWNRKALDATLVLGTEYGAVLQLLHYSVIDMLLLRTRKIEHNDGLPIVHMGHI